MDDTKKHWEKVYESKSPKEVSWFTAKPSVSLDLISKIHLSRDAKIIDVGGGASNLVDHLLDLNFHHLAVLDISSQAITHSKNRLGINATKVQWIEADVTKCQPLGPFDFWHDRAVFHFLTNQNDRDQYKALLHGSLASGTKFILATFAPDGPDKCSGLAVCKYSSQDIMREFDSKFTMLDEVAEVHCTPWGSEQKFIYFLMQKK